MFFILLAGLMAWVWYGILKKDYPIIITNGFSFLVNALIIVFTIKYKKHKPSAGEKPPSPSTIHIPSHSSTPNFPS
jgi:hypothetical protein